VLALSLARRGVPFRIIDDDRGPGAHSRAMAVHARTLELYRQFGFAGAIVDQGVKIATIHLRESKDGESPHELSKVDLSQMGDDSTPYPFVLAYAQDDHERFLVQQLEAAGGRVEWNTSLGGFTQDDAGVRATVVRTVTQDDAGMRAGVVRAGEEREEIAAAYICGCDGPHSRVREVTGVGFPGGTYDQHFYVADVKIAQTMDNDLRMTLGEHTLALMLPVRTTGMQRLIGLVPPELTNERDLSFETIRERVESLLGISVVNVNWFSTYRVHHRVAEHFRIGRAFLAGDAGHIHSPVGAQGMNTGIGDAINLGWKLAHVALGRAGANILDSYEPERIAFARSLVSTTDRAFRPGIAEGLVGEIARRIVAPMVFSVATKFSMTRHAFFRTLSQIRIHYHDSPLSEGQAGDVRGGDRLPWLGRDAVDNFAPLRSLDWQLHVYGDVAPDVSAACAELSLPFHSFGWTDDASDRGFERGASYLVRPDGYVALAASENAAEKLRAYVRRWALLSATAASEEPS
jgi:2-polyprenyl-6-methoxyphenol hydroxylase-like FAD-dependent oxidoreductase